jgi:hypothetical protein
LGGVCPGKRLVRDPHLGPGPGDQLRPQGRAIYEEDRLWRHGGFVYGAFVPATGDAFTAFYDKRNAEGWLDFLKKVEAWLPSEAVQVVAVLDNLTSHYAFEVLLFLLAHPRWEFLFIPAGCAYLNLIEAWWSILRPLAMKGKHLGDAPDVARAFSDATAYWNAHKHPFLWGRRRRHQPKRKPGIALTPGIPSLIGHGLTA